MQCGRLLAEWTRHRLAFSRLTVVREMLDHAGLSYEDLEWTDVDLEAGPAWSPEAVEPGDFLRVGERIAILVADRGEPGVLDRSDLCFDFIKGARVRPLDEIFVGDGLVEWARQGSSSSTPASEREPEESSMSGPCSSTSSRLSGAVDVGSSGRPDAPRLSR